MCLGINTYYIQTLSNCLANRLIQQHQGTKIRRLQLGCLVWVKYLNLKFFPPNVSWCCCKLQTSAMLDMSYITFHVDSSDIFISINTVDISSPVTQGLHPKMNNIMQLPTNICECFMVHHGSMCSNTLVSKKKCFKTLRSLREVDIQQRFSFFHAVSYCGLKCLVTYFWMTQPCLAGRSSTTALPTYADIHSSVTRAGLSTGVSTKSKCSV